MMAVFDAVHWRQPLWLLLAMYPLLMSGWQMASQRRQRVRYADAHLLPWVVSQRWRLASPRSLLQWLAWVCLAIALAGPRSLQTPAAQSSPSMDVMVVTDVSLSMRAQDVSPNRLQRAALELEEWIALMRDHASSRVGVVVYAGKAHTYVPLTDDLDALRFYLGYLDSLVLPSRGSAAADALALAQVQLAAEGNAALPSAVLWITDGDVPSSERESVEAVVGELKTNGIPLYVLGVGTQDGDAIPTQEGQWLQQDGQLVRSALDTDWLDSLATSGGGRFSPVRADASEWRVLYEQGMRTAFPAVIDESTPLWREWFPLPLLLGLVLMLLSWARPRGVLAALMVLSATVSFTPRFAAADVHFDSAVAAYRADDFDTARQQFEAALFAAADDQERARVLYNLGNSYFQLGDYALASETFGDVLRYQPEHSAALHNQALSQQIQADIEAELARQRALGGGEELGNFLERRTNALDWDVRVPLRMDMDEGTEGSNDGAALRQERLEPWVSRGLARLRETGSDDSKGWLKRQQSIDDARIELQQMDGNPVVLWQRLFEEEEGYLAPREQPETLDGVPPW